MLRPDDQPALVLTTDFFTAQVGPLRGVLPVQGMVVRFPEKRRIRRSAATSVINLLAAPELVGLYDVRGPASQFPVRDRVGDLFNVAQYALDLTMTARYEWHGTCQDARSAVRAARRALSAI
jgi:hypothetical protein